MTAHRYRCPRWATAVWLVILLLAGCAGGGVGRSREASGKGAVVVASFNFPESELLADIYGQALTAAGIPVRMELDLGTRELVMPAFEEGLVDVVPEYIGSALQMLAPGDTGGMLRTATVAAQLGRRLASWHGVVLAPSPAQDQNGLAVTRSTASRLRLRSISDLEKVAGRLILTGPPECPVRAYCLVGLRHVYGLGFRGFVPLETESQRVTALEQRVADVAVVFTTSADLAGGDLVLLGDDRHLQPVENVTPIVTSRAVARFGSRLSGALDAVSVRLSTQELRFLNWRVSEAGRAPAAEAHGWLVRQGLAPRTR